MGSTTSIIGLGDDQMVSQFAVIFPEGIPGGGNRDNITLRMDQSFDPPEDTVETYEIVYRGMKVPKTSMTHAMDKTSLTTMVRIDQQWKVHDDLIKWYHRCYNPIDGTALPDSLGGLSTRCTMLIQAYDGQNKVKKTYKFTGVKLKGYKVETFDNASSDPLRMTLNLIFADMVVI